MTENNGERRKLIKEALEALRPREGKQLESTSITAGRDVMIISNSTISSIKITPGREHITEAQAARLKGLVREVARMECLHSKNPVFVPGIWSKLKNKLHVASYKLIPAESFTEAEEFLLKWREQVKEDAARPEGKVKARSRSYRVCHAIAQKYNLYVVLRLLMKMKWQAESMRALSDAALRELQAFMCSLKEQYGREDKMRQ